MFCISERNNWSRKTSYSIFYYLEIHLIHFVFFEPIERSEFGCLFHHHLYFYLLSSQWWQWYWICRVILLWSELIAEIVTETNNTDRMTIDVAIFLSIDFNWRKCLKAKNIKNWLTSFRCSVQSIRSYNINII